MHTCTDAFDCFVSRVLPKRTGPETVRLFRTLGSHVHLKADRQLHYPDDEPTLVFLCDGATKLVAHASDHREQVLAFHFTGDLLTLPAHGAHSYTLEALVDCDLMTFPYAQFLQAAEKHQQVLTQLLERSTVSLQRSREKTLTLGRKSALERVSSFLLSMAERIGRGEGSEVKLDLPMSRRDIADSLGLTIETVSRQFTLLRDQGLIRTQGRSGVTLLRVDELDRRAGHLRVAA